MSHSFNGRGGASKLYLCLLVGAVQRLSLQLILDQNQSVEARTAHLKRPKIQHGSVCEHRDGGVR